MPGRSYSAGNSYRYGFNGKENDNEVKGQGLQLDYGFRVYDPRIGKFLSMDPLFQSYPWYTPYQFAGNKPIAAIDLDGLEEIIKTTQIYTSNPKLNNTVVDKQDGRGLNLAFDKDFVATQLVIAIQWKYPESNIPDNGLFAFWEYPEHPEKNDATYYATVNGVVNRYTIPPSVLKEYNEALSGERSGLNIAGALVNAAAAGALVKAELKAATGELKATVGEANANVVTPLKGSGSVPGVIELNSNIKSSKAFQNGLSKEARDFVYDPTTQKFAMAGKNAEYLKHYGLRRIIGATETNVVDGRIKLGSNGEILTSEWSGTYGQNWTPEIVKKFQEFMNKTSGKEIKHSNSTNFADGTH